MGISKDIFISYKNDGQGELFAEKLKNTLESEGYSVYFNPDETKTGDFHERLEDAIYSCRDFACIVTENYLQALKDNEEICWIREELLFAKKYERNIIPILINNAKMPSSESELPENLGFFCKCDATELPQDYTITPFSKFKIRLKSVNDGQDFFRNIVNSSKKIDSNKLQDSIKKEAEEGSLEAIYKMGMMNFHGFVSDANYGQAVYWLKKIIDMEPQTEKQKRILAKANIHIAYLYYTGSMPREAQSYEKSFHHHRQALYLGNTGGDTGFMKKKGLGCEFDYDSAIEYYLKEIGDSNESMCNMGLAVFYEMHGKFQEASELYLEICDEVPEAAKNLATLYQNGVLSNPPKPNYRQAAYYFKQAADKGSVDAAFGYADLHFRPTGNFKKNFNEAQKYFKIAADQGHMEAQYILGFMYQFGHVEKNDMMALSYYLKASNQGHVYAAFGAGKMYLTSASCQNYQKAFEYFGLAHRRGNSNATFLLANMYLFGCGCEADENKAFTLYLEAEEKGVFEASLMREEAEKIFDNE